MSAGHMRTPLALAALVLLACADVCLSQPVSPPEPDHETVVPLSVLYQGRLTDAGGTPRPGPVTLTFRLYMDAGEVTSLWTEDHPGVPLVDGVFSVLLGSLTPFPTNAWTDPDRWLGISVDGGTEMLPRLRIASVPFAIEANRLNGKRSTDFEPLGAAAIAAAGVASQLKGSDATPPNEGSNQVHWNNMYGMPPGFSDGGDDVGDGVAVHGQLSGLDANDHPQYALNGALQGSDGNPPNVGSNRVHWDNLGSVPIPLVNQLLPREWLEPGSIDSSRIGTGAIAGSNLAPGSVTGSRIQAGSVGTLEVSDQSLTGQDIQNSSITGEDVLNGSLSGIEIQEESLFTTDIANGSILGIDLAAGAVGATQISDGALPGSKLQDGTVSGTKLTDDSIPGATLVAGAVGARELGTGAVTGDNVVDGSLSVVDLADAPGVAYNHVLGFAATITSESGEMIGTLTIAAPGPGYVIVNASAQIYLLHDLGTSSRVALSVSTTPDEIDDDAASIIALPGALPSELYLYPFQTQQIIPVATAGPVTVYLAGKKGGQPRDPSVHNLRIQALYVKSQY